MPAKKGQALSLLLGYDHGPIWRSPPGIPQADWEGRLGDENILSESGVPLLTALPPAAPRVSL